MAYYMGALNVPVPTEPSGADASSFGGSHLAPFAPSSAGLGMAEAKPAVKQKAKRKQFSSCDACVSTALHPGPHVRNQSIRWASRRAESMTLTLVSPTPSDSVYARWVGSEPAIDKD